MPLDKKKIKEKLEKERDFLVSQMKDIGKLNPETNEWEATPEDVGYIETDQNDMADRFEDFESKSSMMKILEAKLTNIAHALKGISRESFGKCEVCKKDIELARMEANPSARTCKKHINQQ
jgi:RNA polymerase-binding transcription factor DksA